MDGAGEAACTTSGQGQGERISKINEHLLPHSFGHFYSAVTGYLGLKMLDGDISFMGLSPYGDPSGAGWICQNLLRSVGPGRYRLESDGLDYHEALRGRFAGAFADLSGLRVHPKKAANSMIGIGILPLRHSAPSRRWYSTWRASCVVGPERRIW